LTGVASLVVMTINAQSDLGHISKRIDAHERLAGHGEMPAALEQVQERVDRTRERQDERYRTILSRLDQIDASLTKLLEERRTGGRR